MKIVKPAISSLPTASTTSMFLSDHRVFMQDRLYKTMIQYKLFLVGDIHSLCKKRCQLSFENLNFNLESLT